MFLSDLLATIPSDTQDRVHRTKERLNQQIREILRQETGLRLRRTVVDSSTSLFPEAEESRSPAQELISVRVQLEPGFPLQLGREQIEEKHQIAALIAPWKNSLERLRDSGIEVDKLCAQLLWSKFGQEAVGPAMVHLPPAVELAERLLKEAATFNLAQWILSVNEDILGIYASRLHQRRRFNEPPRAESWIELYWGAIGLLARLIGSTIENLTVVVLAHELAHAYTHLGADIDGHAWSYDAFGASDHPLKEGLAQFYARTTCKRLELEAPGALAAFDLLLANQPSAYHSHEHWVQDHKPEEVRLAMILVRRAGTATLAEFSERLKDAKKRLRDPKRKPEQPT